MRSCEGLLTWRYVNENKCRRLKTGHARETTAKDSDTRHCASLGALQVGAASPQRQAPERKAR